MLSHQLAVQSRSIVLRLLFIVMAAIVSLAPFGTSAVEAANLRKYAGIVVDAKTGKVLYESHARSTRYPASVTKVMTLYVLFQELEAGNVKLNTKFKVSKYAASAVPTKLGLRAGSTITVENAIKSLVTLSANDMARVIAENISGSEAAFAKRMTTTARALGMRDTTYKNASGLPDRGQVTTAYDQALLGIAVYQHFPKYYEYFQTRSFSYGKRTYGNHNRLLGQNGVDGIKTGYINDAGFNLLTAARKDNRHIVVVGFGFNKSGARNAKVAELVKKYLPKARRGGYLDVAMIPVPGRKGPTVLASLEPVPVVPMPYPAFRRNAVSASFDTTPGEATHRADAIEVASVGAPVPTQRPEDLMASPALEATRAMAIAPEDDRPLDVIGAWLSDTFSLGPTVQPLGQTQPSAPLLPPVGIGESGEPIDLMTSGSIGRQQTAALTAPVNVPETPAPSLTQAPVASGWIVQIGAMPTENGARSLLNDAASRISTLDSARAFVQRFEKDGQVFFRARFGGFGGREDAAGMCNQLKKAKMSCLAMQS
ncbi:serine hydrolase [Devosia sp.]|uniref:serine hydrolase n=1 Tax=Devosia sp. TaxID=1871048 RepID=UPI003A949F17